MNYKAAIIGFVCGTFVAALGCVIWLSMMMQELGRGPQGADESSAQVIEVGVISLLGGLGGATIGALVWRRHN